MGIARSRDMDVLGQEMGEVRVLPVNGTIYRTAGNESLLVLGVRADGVFIEFADGRLKRISYREWDRLNPNPARC